MSCNSAPWSAGWMTPWKDRMRDVAQRATGPVPTGNVAFDEYREGVLKRLEEERRQLDAQQAVFAEFLKQLRRAKDQEEFDRFMDGRRPSA